MDSTERASSQLTIDRFVSNFRTSEFKPDIVICPRVKTIFSFEPGQETSVGKVQYKISPNHGASHCCSRSCFAERAPSTPHKRKRSYPLEAPTLTRAEAQSDRPSADISRRLSEYLNEHTKLGLSLVKSHETGCRRSTGVHSVAVISPEEYKATLHGPRTTLSGETAFDSSFRPLSQRRANHVWTTMSDAQGQVTQVEIKSSWKPSPSLIENLTADTANSPTDLARRLGNNSAGQGTSRNCHGFCDQASCRRDRTITDLDTSSEESPTKSVITAATAGDNAAARPSSSQVIPVIMIQDADDQSAGAFVNTVGTADESTKASLMRFHALEDHHVDTAESPDEEGGPWLDAVDEWLRSALQ